MDLDLFKREMVEARRIQLSYSPAEPLSHPGIRVFGKSFPATVCSGDWFQYRVLDDFLILLVGDATGHGVSAAFSTAAVFSVFNLICILRLHGYFSKKHEFPKPGKFIKYLDECIKSSGMGEISMTLFCASIDLRSGHMHYLSAGHPSPLIFRPDPSAEGGGRWIPVVSSFTIAPLGEIGSPVGLNDYDSMTLEPGDSLLAYSDGLLEDQANPQRRRGKREIAHAVQRGMASIESDDTRAAVDSILGSLGFLEGRALRDDVTLVLAHRPQNGAAGLGK